MSITKQVSVAALVISLLTAPLYPAVGQAHTANNETTSRSTSDPNATYDLIVSGMWAGANLDATPLPHEHPAPVSAVAQPMPRPVTASADGTVPVGQWGEVPGNYIKPGTQTPAARPSSDGTVPVGQWGEVPGNYFRPGSTTSTTARTDDGTVPVGQWGQVPGDYIDLGDNTTPTQRTSDGTVPIGQWGDVPGNYFNPGSQTQAVTTNDGTVPVGQWGEAPAATPTSQTTQTTQATQSAPTTRQGTVAPVSAAPAAAPAGRQNIYVALGDSVAAGAGLPARAGATADDLRCGRSSQAYPYEVARALQRTWYHVACSGATAGDMVTKQRVDGPNIAPQLDAAFATGIPGVMTITAGANDADWDGFIRKCYAFDCTDRSFTLLANARLVSMQAKLYYLFSSIKARSGSTPPQVIITGYYNPLSPECAKLQSNITAREITWLSGEVKALNQTIKNVVDRYPFVQYVDVNFTGHDICSASPWIQGPSGAAPFHPTAEGQKAIAASVVAAIRR